MNTIPPQAGLCVYKSLSGVAIRIRSSNLVLRMRGTMPAEDSVIVLMAKIAMDKKACFKALPWIERDKVLFPGDSGNFPDLLNNS